MTSDTRAARRPTSGDDDDALIVGSGLNSLVCAALLARAGWRVRILERNDRPGGAIRSDELAEPGFVHDLFSCWHSSWVLGPASAELGDELVGLGLEYLNTDYPAATAFPDGSAAFLLRAAEDTAAEFERLAPGDGETWLRLLETVPVRERLALELGRREFGLSGALRLLIGGARAGVLELAELSAGMVESARDWLERGFASPAVRGLLAPWALHAGMGPDAAGSGFATRLIALGKQRAGSPLPRGGGSRLVEALVLLIERHGGAVELGVDVERILVHAGKARGVVTAGGRVVPVQRAVICNVTPTQLYGRLLADPPAEVAAAARGYRYGLADLQIHYALSDPPRWRGDARLDSTAVVHVTAGIDGISRAVNEGQRGLLPVEPTLVVGQPLTVDASRAPAGAGMLWVQVVELPWRVRGDAANELDCGGGEWTPTLRERYVERVHDQLARHIDNLDSGTIARTALSPADLAAGNINLVHGDPYSGAGTLDQSLIWRPFPRGSRHRTPVDGLWHIGASTHPGPGLSGTSGYLVGRALLSRRRRRR